MADNIEKRYPSPDIRNIPRDQKRLEIEKRVRLAYPELSIIDTEWKRMKFLWLVWGELKPEFGRWLKSQLYENPRLFEELDLPSSDTILKDNRELEREGFFSKPKDEPAIIKEIARQHKEEVVNARLF